MKIKEWLQTKHPSISNIEVEICEINLNSHPPKYDCWTYDETWEVDAKPCVLRSGKNPQLTGAFNLLSPIIRSVAQIKSEEEPFEHKGAIPPYHTDGGETINRSFTCKISFSVSGLENSDTSIGD